MNRKLMARYGIFKKNVKNKTAAIYQGYSEVIEGWKAGGPSEKLIWRVKYLFIYCKSPQVRKETTD